MKKLAALLLLGLNGCSDIQALTERPPPANFTEYRLQTAITVERDRRFQSNDHELELAWNTPREWLPVHPNGKGILLVHGLGDSPGSFSDIAPRLAGQGYRVRTLLLAGHGTKPSDMLQVDLKDWQQAVQEQVKLLRREEAQVYLGGFSTGANLVLEYAMDDPSIAGLLLFSPAFRSSLHFDWLVPWLVGVRPWFRQPTGPAPQQTPLRYQNVPTNGFVQFYRSSTAVRSKLATRTFDRPALLVSAAHDSVVDVAFIRETFRHRFTNPASRMIWYGELAEEHRNSRMLVLSDHLPAEYISQFSHMGVLFAPENSQYGRQGAQRLCSNGQSDAGYSQCLAGVHVWYSDWGYREAGKVHARLTYNPYFEWQAQVMAEVMQAAGPQRPDPENTR